VPVGSTAVDDTTIFSCFEQPEGMASLPIVASLQALKDGVPDLGGGVSATTPVAILVELPSASSAASPAPAAAELASNATVDSVTINGVEKL